jgi:hypothetical protein
MLEFLKEVSQTDYDIIFFIPGPTEDSIEIEGSQYKDRGVKVGGTDLGDEYHIILFKEDEDGKPYELDKFDAILGEPLDYISNLIPMDWYGIVSRKTTTSGILVEKLFDNLIEV